MTLPYETTILKDRLRSLIDIEGITDGEVYLQVTRGVLSPRNHVFPPQGTIKVSLLQMLFHSIVQWTCSVMVFKPH